MALSLGVGKALDKCVQIVFQFFYQIAALHQHHGGYAQVAYFGRQFSEALCGYRTFCLWVVHIHIKAQHMHHHIRRECAHHIQGFIDIVHKHLLRRTMWHGKIVVVHKSFTATTLVFMPCHHGVEVHRRAVY